MAEHIDVRIGRNLRRIREAAGLDVDALACRTGLQPAVIGLYEAGRLRLPVDALALLADALSRPVRDFFA